MVGAKMLLQFTLRKAKVYFQHAKVYFQHIAYSQHRSTPMWGGVRREEGVGDA